MNSNWPSYGPPAGQPSWNQGPSFPPPGRRRSRGPAALLIILGVVGLLTASAIAVAALVVYQVTDDAEDARDEASDRVSEALEDVPTDIPTDLLSDLPTDLPSGIPTEIPTDLLTDLPTDLPTEIPTEIPTDVPTEAPGDPGPVDVLSADGFTALVDSVRAETGGATVFSAIVYPEYAVVDLPVDKKSLRKSGKRWDGTTLSDFGSTGTAIQERVDLGAVDPALLRKLTKKASALVDDPTSTYVIIQGKLANVPDDKVRITAYAINEYNETAYIATDIKGKEIRRYVG